MQCRIVTSVHVNIRTWTLALATLRGAFSPHSGEALIERLFCWIRLYLYFICEEIIRDSASSMEADNCHTDAQRCEKYRPDTALTMPSYLPENIVIKRQGTLGQSVPRACIKTPRSSTQAAH